MEDKKVSLLLTQELKRQQNSINLIASENYTDSAVLQATGSVLTNKYAEGYPSKRYYAGCEYVDQLEQLAIERVKELFGAEHANVQPHSGSQANMAVFHAALQPGDLIMGMSLAEGGHLTHGYAMNFSGRYYVSKQYTVDIKTEQLDYDAIEQLAIEHKPKMIIAGASAYSRAIDFERISKIAKKVNALFMADIAHIAGLVAAGIHPSPFPHADFVTSTTHKTLRGPRGGLIMCKKEFAAALDRAIMPGIQGGPFMHVIAAKAVAFGQALKPEFKEYQKQVVANAKTMAAEFLKRGYRIVSGGTDNHLFIVDLRNKHISGKDAEAALEKAGITVSRSCIPFDTAKPTITSGIRIGSPAITTRGFKEAEAREVVHLIDRVILHATDEAMLEQIKKQVEQLCWIHPLYEAHASTFDFGIPFKEIIE